MALSLINVSDPSGSAAGSFVGSVLLAASGFANAAADIVINDFINIYTEITAFRDGVDSNMPKPPSVVQQFVGSSSALTASTPSSNVQFPNGLFPASLPPVFLRQAKTSYTGAPLVVPKTGIDLIPENFDLPTDFLQQQTALYNDFTGVFASYFGTYFNIGDYLTPAASWITTALGMGGTGVNTAVEARIWERDRSRLFADSARAQDEILTTWAARGFPLPPGAATYQVLRLQQDLQDKIAAQSRDVAINTFKTEIENVRIAVDKSIQLRQLAVSTAIEYMTAYAAMQSLNKTLQEEKIELKFKFIEAMRNLYVSENQGQLALLNAQLAVSQEQTRYDFRRLDELNLAIEERVKAGVSEAQSLSSIAAAAVNALRASASLNGSEQV